MMQDSLEPSKFWQDLPSEQSEWLQNHIQKKEQEKTDHMKKWVYDNLEVCQSYYIINSIVLFCHIYF